MSERVLVRRIKQDLWQWREVSTQGAWRAEAYYTGDINLLKETVAGKVVWLVLPGQSVVAQRVAADVKDRAQLLKLLPFEIEDNVVDPIEDMHFAYGEIKAGTIPVAYGDMDWLSACIEEVEQAEADVVVCSVDYLQLPRAAEGWTLLLENDLLLALTDDGEGFCIEQQMAPLYLSALAETKTPQSVKLYADSDEALYSLSQMLPESISSQESISVDEEVAGFWDVIAPSQNVKANFRAGKLARKLPFAKWWEDYKVPIIATAAAFLLAFTTTWLGQSKAANDRKQIMTQTDDIYRQVVPNGKINDPGRQLRAMLGKGGSSSAEPSNAVYLISRVGPAISAISNIKVKSFRYNVSKKELQMNLEGSSYEEFESLRGKIVEVGFDVDIKSQSAHGDNFQAQLRVSEAS